MLRFIIALLILRVKPTITLFAPVVRRFRVKPWDLDLNIHLNNAKYLKYLDKGRVEHIINCHPIRQLYHRQYKLIVANTEISYIRSLLPFQPFSVASKITGWDHKYVYYEQRFESQGQLYAIAVIRLALLKGNTTTSPVPVFEQLTGMPTGPELPGSVQLFNQLIRAQRQESSTTKSTAIHQEQPDHPPTLETPKIKESL